MREQGRRRLTHVALATSGGDRGMMKSWVRVKCLFDTSLDVLPTDGQHSAMDAVAAIL